MLNWSDIYNIQIPHTPTYT